MRVRDWTHERKVTSRLWASNPELVHFPETGGYAWPNPEFRPSTGVTRNALSRDVGCAHARGPCARRLQGAPDTRGRRPGSGHRETNDDGSRQFGLWLCRRRHETPPWSCPCPTTTFPRSSPPCSRGRIWRQRPRARVLHGLSASSPSIALLKDGELVYMMERHEIEGGITSRSRRASRRRTTSTARVNSIRLPVTCVVREGARRG